MSNKKIVNKKDEVQVKEIKVDGDKIRPTEGANSFKIVIQEEK